MFFSIANKLETLHPRNECYPASSQLFDDSNYSAFAISVSLTASLSPPSDGPMSFLGWPLSLMPSIDPSYCFWETSSWSSFVFHMGLSILSLLGWHRCAELWCFLNLYFWWCFLVCTAGTPTFSQSHLLFIEAPVWFQTYCPRPHFLCIFQYFLQSDSQGWRQLACSSSQSQGTKENAALPQHSHNVSWN